MARLRPYWLHVYLLVFLALLLVADARLKTFWPQCGLGVLTFLVLWLGTLRLPAPRNQRRRMWTDINCISGSNPAHRGFIGSRVFLLSTPPSRFRERVWGSLWG